MGGPRIADRELQMAIATMGPKINKSALIIVDTQNDFVRPEGGFALRAREMPEAGIDMGFLMGRIPRVKRLAEAFRKAGRPVVYIAHVLKPDYSDAQFSYSRLGLPESGNRTFIVEGPGARRSSTISNPATVNTWSSRKATADSRTRRSTRYCATWVSPPAL
jgi:nicotinamidase-related amidase